MDLLVPDVRVAKISPQFLDNTGRFTSPLSGSGRSIARPGDRWSFQLDYQNLLGVDRARLEAFIGYMRGAANRALYSPGDYVQRGVFPSGELFANNNFAQSSLGSTWGTEGAGNSIIWMDRMIRAVRNQYDGTINGLVAPKNIGSLTLTAFLPYLIRFSVLPGRGNPNGVVMYNDNSADGYVGSYGGVPPWLTAKTNAFGMLSGVRVPVVTGLYNFGVYPSVFSGGMAGDYYDVTWSSCAQCFLVDNGANMLLWSDDFTQTAWGKTNATVSLSAAYAPDGTLTADSLVETSATGGHLTQQAVTIPSGVEDICFTVTANSATRTWLTVQLNESIGNTALFAFFNTATGAVGSTGVGTNWSSLRTFSQYLGNGWYQLTIVGRKTNAATGVTATLVLGINSTTNSYAGTTGNGLQIWRATVALSSVPVRLVQSTSTGVPAALQTGNAIYVKGLPVSTNQLLLPGDWIEINSELKRITNALNSDGNGLGYLVFTPPIRNSPNDNDPVVVNSPMGRFLLKTPATGWASVPLYFASSSLVLEESPT